MFHLSPVTLMVLIVLALFIFGPDRLPKAVAEAVRTLRKVRTALHGATEEFREDLGPEFRDLRLRDLHPKTLIQRHLLADEPEPADDPAAQPPAPRSAPQGWPEHVPFPSGAEMGLGPDDDPLTAPIPRGKTIPVREPETHCEPADEAALTQSREHPRDAAHAGAQEAVPHGNVGRD